MYVWLKLKRYLKRAGLGKGNMKNTVVPRCGIMQSEAQILTDSGKAWTTTGGRQKGHLAGCSPPLKVQLLVAYWEIPNINQKKAECLRAQLKPEKDWGDGSPWPNISLEVSPNWVGPRGSPRIFIDRSTTQSREPRNGRNMEQTSPNIGSLVSVFWPIAMFFAVLWLPARSQSFSLGIDGIGRSLDSAEPHIFKGFYHIISNKLDSLSSCFIGALYFHEKTSHLQKVLLRLILDHPNTWASSEQQAWCRLHSACTAEDQALQLIPFGNSHVASKGHWHVGHMTNEQFSKQTSMNKRTKRQGNKEEQTWRQALLPLNSKCSWLREREISGGNCGAKNMQKQLIWWLGEKETIWGFQSLQKRPQVLQNSQDLRPKTGGLAHLLLSGVLCKVLMLTNARANIKAHLKPHKNHRINYLPGST